MYRIGNGIDFHKLELNPGRPFLLGGYQIETELALIGHSDADILIHAISDSILGALALGDIGSYFPDTDQSFKNMDSKIILKSCLDIMKSHKYEIENIDSTIICEKPKISPFRAKIQESLSMVIEIPKESISVKATTSEKMGALGRSEGVGVFSTILLKKTTS